MGGEVFGSNKGGLTDYYYHEVLIYATQPNGEAQIVPIVFVLNTNPMEKKATVSVSTILH